MDKTDRTERKKQANAGAAVRIVIWLLVLGLLGGLFAVCLMGYYGGGENDGWFPQILNLGFANSYWYDDSDYSVGDHAFTERITALDIDWLAGSVTIVPGEGDTLTIHEESPKGDIDTSDQLRWCMADGKLTVKFCGPARLLAFHIPEKRLTVTVPAAWLEDMPSVKLDTASASVKVNGLLAERLDVDTASGDITLTDVTVHKLDVNTTSGQVQVTNASADVADVDTTSGGVFLSGYLREVDVDTVSGGVELTLFGKAYEISIDTNSGKTTVEGYAYIMNIGTVSGQVNLTLTGEAGEVSVSSTSGDISVTGAADEVDLDTTSGTMTLTLTKAARKVSADSVSGRLEIHLPDTVPGFTVNMDSVSGELTVNGFATQGGNRRQVYGDGSMTIDCDTVSGNVTISNDAEGTN